MVGGRKERLKLLGEGRLENTRAVRIRGNAVSEFDI